MHVSICCGETVSRPFSGVGEWQCDNCGNETETIEISDDFGDTMVSGWTDAEIEAFDAYLAECDRYTDADLPPLPAGTEIGEPPF